MPDGRFLSKSVASDWSLNSVSLEADYLFTRCVPHLDREGRMPGHPSEVKGAAVPLRHEMTVDDVDRCLGELASASLVLWYVVDGRPCLEFPGFDRNQRGLRKDREADSRIPSSKVRAAQRITTLLRSRSGVDPENSRSTPAEVEVKVEVKELPSHARAREGGGDEKTEVPEYTERELFEAAEKTLGLGILTNDAKRSNERIIRGWIYGRPTRSASDVWAAIHGAAQLRDEGTSWLEKGKPYSLAPLVKAGALRDQGDGKAKTTLWQLAVERYYAEDTSTRSRTSGAEPAGDVAARIVGRSA